MPLFIKDFTWQEDLQTVTIVVPLKGIKTSNVSLLSSPNYIKVSFPPYLFELFLYKNVIEEKSVAKVGNGAVTYLLMKTNLELWGQLSLNCRDKSTLNQIRQEALKYAEAKLLADKKDKAKRKDEGQRYAVKEEMKIEAKERERIQSIKTQEQEKLTAELEHFLKSVPTESHETEEKICEKPEARENNIVGKHASEMKSVQKPKKDVKNAAVAVRKNGTITISFTPRSFPTPVRESHSQMEEEWLKKQAEAKKLMQIDDENLEPSEKDPVWLMQKGNNLMQIGNIESAINVFSHAIRLNAKLPEIYSNRAHCFLKTNAFIRAVDDCSKALDLLVPPVETNRKERVKAHVRRGTAFFELELYAEALQDYECALKLDPQNSNLLRDTAAIRNFMQNGEVTDNIQLWSIS